MVAQLRPGDGGGPGGSAAICVSGGGVSLPLLTPLCRLRRHLPLKGGEGSMGKWRRVAAASLSGCRPGRGRRPKIREPLAPSAGVCRFSLSGIFPDGATAPSRDREAGCLLFCLSAAARLSALRSRLFGRDDEGWVCGVLAAALEANRPRRALARGRGDGRGEARSCFLLRLSSRPQAKPESRDPLATSAGVCRSSLSSRLPGQA